MKRHLFYTFLSIFVITSVITLLGITGIIHIADGYLTPLVGAFLIESAGAVVAIFRRADFFSEESQQHKLDSQINTPLSSGFDFDEDGGFYVDRKTRHAVCTRCLKDGAIVHLKRQDIGLWWCHACRSAYVNSKQQMEAQQAKLK